MASINELFVTLVSEGIKASKAISDPKDKALACAELAKAIAATGLVYVQEEEKDTPAADVVEAKEAIKENKSGAKKPKAPKEEPVAEEPEVVEPEVTEAEVAEDTESSEVEITEEWTDEMVALFEEELDVINSLRDQYEEEALDACVVDFSEGQLKEVGDITPLNIKGFVAYVQMLLSEQAE